MILWIFYRKKKIFSILSFLEIEWVRWSLRSYATQTQDIIVIVTVTAETENLENDIHYLNYYCVNFLNKFISTSYKIKDEIEGHQLKFWICLHIIFSLALLSIYLTRRSSNTFERCRSFLKKVLRFFLSLNCVSSSWWCDIPRVAIENASSSICILILKY